MYSNSKRFNHCPFSISQIIRQGSNFADFYSKVLTCSTGCLESHYLKFFAQIILAMFARITFAAVDLWLNRNFLTDMKTSYLRSDRINSPGYFMALSHRIFCKWMLSMVYMDITSTDTYFHDFNYHFICFRNRFWNVFENDLTRSCHNLLFHLSHPLSFDFSIIIFLYFVNYFIKIFN